MNCLSQAALDVSWGLRGSRKPPSLRMSGREFLFSNSRETSQADTFQLTAAFPDCERGDVFQKMAEIDVECCRARHITSSVRGANTKSLERYLSSMQSLEDSRCDMTHRAWISASYLMVMLILCHFAHLVVVGPSRLFASMLYIITPSVDYKTLQKGQASKYLGQDLYIQSSPLEPLLLFEHASCHEMTLADRHVVADIACHIITPEFPLNHPRHATQSLYAE